jgi:stage II sporulation protein D
MSRSRFLIVVPLILLGIGLCLDAIGRPNAHATEAANEEPPPTHDIDLPLTDPLYFARWNINYGEYLIDVGQYLEALETFQTAIEATDHPQIKAIAHLQRASTLALFLDAYEEASHEYTQVVQLYPQTPQVEIARFRLGMLAFEQQDYERAATSFRIYLDQHPQGRFAASASTLMAQSQAAPTTPAARVPTDEVTRPMSLQPRTYPQVRVRLLKAVNRILLSSTGSLAVSTPDGRVLRRPTGKVSFYPGRNAIHIGKTSLGVRDIRITSSAPLTLYSRAIRCQRHQPVQAGLYRGSLRIFLLKGKLRAVNEVDIEPYLYGVVPVEVPASWPFEALKSQAIAARTYALYQSEHRRHWGHDLVDKAGDQVYKGMRCEQARSTQAVDATRGMLLVHRRQPILAMFTSNTGWHSDSVGHIFGTSLPYLVGVPDPYSPTQPMGKWRRTYSADEVRRKLAGIGLSFGVITDIRPQQVTPSGRVTQVQLVHPQGSHTLRARTTLRRALDLPDVLLQISRREQTFVFEGGGFGHGVGLSQWGAKRMAEAGKTAPEILHFYYDHIDLHKVW